MYEKARSDMLCVQIQDATVLGLEMEAGPKAREAWRWRVLYHDGSSKDWESGQSDLRSALNDEDIYISIDQEADGQHLFLRLAEAWGSPKVGLSLVKEAKVKELQVHQMFARAYEEEPTALTSWNYPELAPHGYMTNYSVVPWISLGRTQALILSDEQTLCSPQPRELIFDHVTLIVNCHEDRCSISKYRACKKKPPQVISHAVHRWFSHGPTIVEKNHTIQKAIWHHLHTNQGSVAIHCLAGIHRAACIAACQFLFRHYILGHTHIESDPALIYKHLKSVRPAVAPAYLDILRQYEQHCIRQATLRRANELTSSSS